MRRLAIALLLVLTAAAQTVGARAEQAALSAPPSLPSATVTQREGQDATVLRIDGVLTPEVAARLDTAIARLPAGRPLLLELHSPGGYTNAGYAMIDRVMAERGAGRRVATAVRAGEACESMCVGLYLAGYPRYAAPSAQFMVHAPRTADEGRMTLRMTQTMVNRLVSLGASVGWIERVKAAGGFSGAVDYRDSAEGLKAADANVVTDLEP